MLSQNTFSYLHVFCISKKKRNFIMLDAEDTKERIRKLRLRVISEPKDINEFAKIKENLNSSKENEIFLEPNNIENQSFLNFEDSAQTLKDKKNNKKKVFLNDYEEDLNNYDDLGSNLFSQTYIQNEIDKRIKNNSNLIIDIFNERVDNLKNQIVKLENLSEFKDDVIEQIEGNIIDLTDKLNYKINDIEQQNHEKEIKLANLIKIKIDELENTAYEKIDSFSKKINSYEDQFPNILKSLEEKIYKDINRVVSEFGSKIIEEKNKISLHTDIIKNDFSKTVENLDQINQTKINDFFNVSNSNFENFEKKTNDNIDLIKESITKEKNENYNQLMLFQDTHNTLKKDFENFKDSVGIKSDAIVSEITFQIDDLNSNFVEKIDELHKEFENYKNILGNENNKLVEDVNKKFIDLESSLSSVVTKLSHDNQNLRSNLEDKFFDLENDTILKITNLTKTTDEKLNNTQEVINTNKIELENNINEVIDTVSDRVSNLNQTLQVKISDSINEIESKYLSFNNKLREDVEYSKTHSKELNENTNSNFKKLQSEFDDFQKNINSEINLNKVEQNDILIQKLKELDHKHSDKLLNIKKDYQCKINKIEEKFSGFRKILEDQYAELKDIISDNKQEIIDCKKEFFDNQKEQELRLSQSDKNVIGLFKDKYKTLKSMIWQEFTSLTRLSKKNLEKINQIEKQMVTTPTLKENINKHLTHEKKKINFLINSEINKINKILKTLENRILDEDELTEIFQNHTLNVNISKNKNLLSKVRKDYEKRNVFYKSFFTKSKITSSVILISSSIAIFKILF